MWLCIYVQTWYTSKSTWWGGGKSRIWETKHLSTDADSSTDTTVGCTWNTQKPNFFEKQKKISEMQKLKAWFPPCFVRQNQPANNYVFSNYYLLTNIFTLYFSKSSNSDLHVTIGWSGLFLLSFFATQSFLLAYKVFWRQEKKKKTKEVWQPPPGIPRCHPPQKTDTLLTLFYTSLTLYIKLIPWVTSRRRTYIWNIKLLF